VQLKQDEEHPVTDEERLIVTERLATRARGMIIPRRRRQADERVGSRTRRLRMGRLMTGSTSTSWRPLRH
jgi:hypothetical protein